MRNGPIGFAIALASTMASAGTGGSPVAQRTQRKTERSVNQQVKQFKQGTDQ
jgi:hypothetical protein